MSASSDSLPGEPSVRPDGGLTGSTRPQDEARLVRGLQLLLVTVYAITASVLVVFVGGLLGSEQPITWETSLVALLLLALSVPPLSRWFQRGLERLILDWPEDPYGALRQLQAELAQNPSPAAIIPTVAATLSTTLRLPYAAISSPDGMTVRVGAPPAGAERVVLPLRYGEVAVGSLEVAARRPGAALSASELRLLNELARQVGITLHAAHLSEALQASRAQLVAAREEERRRIRRDLHDGLGPTLASMRLQIGVVVRTLRSDPAAAEAVLDELRADITEATSAIRRLVYDLRPPLLDEHGLAGALRSLSRLVEPLTLGVELPENLPPLPAAVEVALYRIAAEALHNVARHARTTSCVLALEVGVADVELRVRDNGTGLPADYREGVGLAAMRERAEELGGSLSLHSSPDSGATVVARIPWRAAEGAAWHSQS